MVGNVALYMCTTAFYPVDYWETLGCFQILAIINNAAMNRDNIRVYKYSFTLVFWVSLNIYREELLVCKAVPSLIFPGNYIVFSIMVAPIYIPTKSARWFPFLHFLTNKLICWFIDESHSESREVISHCGFN